MGLAPAVAGGGDLHFLSVVPRGDGLEAVVAGRGLDQKAAELVVFAGGAEIAAKAAPAGKNKVRFVLGAGVTGSLAAGLRGSGPEAVVELGEEASPFAGLSVYHIMVGYFRNGMKGNDDRVEGWRHPNWAGGDLQGVLEKADYLAELGVNAVWLSPIFKARTSHGYDVLDYYAFGNQYAVPDDRGASQALFRRLVGELHARGIKVILDLPLNHAHRAYDREHGDPGGFEPRFTAARQDAEKLWESWGAEYGYWNAGHPPTRRFLIEVALHYLVEEGVDGLRLDYVRGLDHEFWAELYAAAKARKPEAWLLGECWLDAQGAAANAAEIAAYYAPAKGRKQFDSLVDFPMQILATEVFAKGGSLVLLENWLQHYPVEYGEAAEPAFFLDNHDLSRFLAWTDDQDRLVAALTFFASLSDPLVVFYGSEAGLANGGPKPGFSDAGRIPIPWERLDPKLSGQVRRLLAARKSHPALTHGARLPLVVEKDLLVFAKRHAEELALVAVNLGSSARKIELELGTLLGEESLEALLGPAPVRQGGRITWELPQMSTSIGIAGPPKRP
jgi:cyclomaltodextrinase / maltogenic alpha-amylase / neopullulanase